MDAELVRSKRTVTTFEGKLAVKVPYARLLRIERVRVSGIDETEDNSGEEGGANGEERKPVKGGVREAKDER